MLTEFLQYWKWTLAWGWETTGGERKEHLFHILRDNIKNPPVFIIFNMSALWTKKRWYSGVQALGKRFYWYAFPIISPQGGRIFLPPCLIIIMYTVYFLCFCNNKNGKYRYLILLIRLSNNIPSRGKDIFTPIPSHHHLL